MKNVSPVLCRRGLESPHITARATLTPKEYGVASLLGVEWARMLFLSAHRANREAMDAVLDGPVIEAVIVDPVGALLVEAMETSGDL